MVTLQTDILDNVICEDQTAHQYIIIYSRHILAPAGYNVTLK